MTAPRLAPRTYPDIVRDVLTTLTAGVAGEEHTVPAAAATPAGERPEPVTIQLRRRPVRRVSSVTGWVAPPGAPRPPESEDLIAATFTLDDYELVAEADDPDALNTIRFRPFAGKVPAPGTTVVVNYYPRSAHPSPITDVTVGSVTRTLLEAVSHELAVLYGQLEQAYQSAFLDTATGSSLDRVVGLLGYSRARAGRPVGSVRFSRRPGAAGTIVIPAGTPVTDTKDTVRYETSESRTMLAGESTTEIRVRGADPATPVVGAGVLTVVQRAIAGIDSVTNETPTALATTNESDEELRARARVALLASNKGTVPAIRNGLLQLPAVRAVTVEEMPNGVAGEIRVTVGLADPADAGPGELPASVEAKLEELRPAGVRLVRAAATPQSLAADVALTTAGGARPPAEVERLTQRVASKISDTVRRTGVGQRVRIAGLVAVALAEEGVIDAQIRVGRRGETLGAAGADFQPDPGAMVDLDPADVAAVVTAEDEGAGGGETRVLVRATLTATTVGATTASDVEQAARAALTPALRRPAPGTRFDAPSLLALLRDDARFGLNPLGCRFTFTAGEQFVDVAQGGAAFTVQAGQRFEIEAVVVREAGT